MPSRNWNRRIRTNPILKRIKNTTLWLGILLVFLAFAPAVHWVERQSMFEIADGLLVGAGLGCIIRWGPAAWKAIMPPIHELRAADHLVVGLGLVFCGLIFRFAGQWYWRAMDKPDWFINSSILLYFTLAITIGLYLLMMPTFTENGGKLTVAAAPKTFAIMAVSLVSSILLICSGWG